MRPVFIVGNPRSGTSLVQSLLDGHPELFVVPVELHFFNFLPLPSLPPGNMPPNPLPGFTTPIPRGSVEPETLKEEILAHAELGDLLASGHAERNIHLPGDRFDREAYREFVESADVDGFRDLYMALWQGFPQATGDRREPSRYRFVIKCPHLEEYAVELARWFPNARFVHVLRNPRATAWSLLRPMRRRRYLDERILRPMAKSFYFMERNRRYLDGYRIVRYEDVVLETRETMDSLASHLGVSFHGSLLEPTIGGRPWSGNPGGSEGALQGVDARPVSAYEEQIPSLLDRLVGRFFSPLMSRYGYKRPDAGGTSAWLPLRWETPWQYVQNRRLLWRRVL